MLWASCKDYANSTSNESDIFKCTRSGMVFWFGGFFFSWKITCIVDVSREPDEKNVKITNVKFFEDNFLCLPEKFIVFQTLDFKRSHRPTLLILPMFIYSCPTGSFYLENVCIMLDSTVYILQHIIGFHYDFEMLIYLLNKLNYLICFECFRLLHNTIF